MTYDITVELHESVPELVPTFVDLDAIAALIERVLPREAVEDETAVTLVLGDDAFLHQLNRQHRGVDEPTDVLSFEGFQEGFLPPPDEPPYLGDIAISIAAAERQAGPANLEPLEELEHLVVHGLLHILGYDHDDAADDAAMRAREELFLGPRIHASRPEEGHASHG